MKERGIVTIGGNQLIVSGEEAAGNR